MGVIRRRFDPEFRAGAVRIVKETGKPVSHVARDLGINEYTLHNWMQMDRHASGRVGGNGGGSGKLTESEQEELARLRREKAELARQHAKEKAAWEKERAELEGERDVLKRSVVLWVKEAMGR
ncbi:transposase [Nonomuraea sp. NPDC026600]|uniref:transposase n=1 Tax=Nonomuraea sp. NPDC026600 TaxID=3155363 RepID=UPI0033BFD794